MVGCSKEHRCIKIKSLQKQSSTTSKTTQVPSKLMKQETLISTMQVFNASISRNIPKGTLFLLLALLSSTCLAQNDPPFSSCSNDTYYQPLGSFDSWTRDSIGNLLKDTHHRVLPYTGSSGRDDVWKALQALDAGVEPDTVNLIYSEQDVKGSDHGTASTWNREHLWPKSHGVGLNGADFTDIHHLRPADWNVNSARSNLYFGACGLVQDISKCQIPAHPQAANDTSKDSSVFLPPVHRRGDVARALFYMDLRYFGGAGDVDLELTDCPRPENDNQMAYLSQLLEWHIADEVDDAERKRNDRACELWQGNRNIFVDHPELVAKIYGTPQMANSPNGYICNNVDNEQPTPSPGPINQNVPTTTTHSCSDLLPGDVQIIAINSDNPDSVTLVTLETLPGGLKLYMTDNAWTGESFLSNEGTIMFTVPDEGIPKGAIFGYMNQDSSVSGWERVSGTFALAAAGDTIIVYCVQDADTTIHPLGALSFSDEWSAAGLSSYSTATSALPDSLVRMAPALPHFDNYEYDGITIGDKKVLQTALVDSQNWVGSNSEVAFFEGASFTVTSSAFLSKSSLTIAHMAALALSIL